MRNARNAYDSRHTQQNGELADNGVQPGPAQTSTTSYDIHVDAPAAVKAGAEAWARVEVSPQAPWHLNVDFPARLRVRTPAADVELGATDQRKTDAERLDDDGLVFAVPFVATRGGTKDFNAEISFAMCGEQACAPVTVPVDWQVQVGCKSQALSC